MATQSKNTEVSDESIYSELCNELRRYRDYELTAATWYTAILLALLAFYASAKFGSDGEYVRSLAASILVLSLSTVLGFSSCYSVWFAHWRYSDIRDIVREKHLEPKWVVDAFKKITDKKAIPPRYLIYLIQLLLVLATWFVVLCT